MTLSGRWSYPNAIRFGAGRIAELPQACIEAGMQRPLLVTDRGLAKLDVTARALTILEEAGFAPALFAEVDPNPNEVNLAEGVAAYRAGEHDGVIAFGGGSGLDLGKMVAFMAGQIRPVWDFEDVADWWTRADSDAIAPIVAVPTTAGTGSEVGRASVITNSRTHEKKIIFHPKILPAIVLADPELTVGMPPHITAGTGLDAFAHCVEAFSSPHYHPMSQGIALEGMRLVIEHLPRAYAEPDDLEARTHMMSAASMGAVGFQKGLGAIHALSHPIGAVFNTHHGTTNAVCMPVVLDFNADAISDRFDRAAPYLGIEGGFDGFRAFVDRFNDGFGVPKRLRDLGADPARIDELVPMALRDPSCGGNPVELTEAGLRDLFERVI
ncbi:iron-containing alcohol dehydrogenase [uncultured Jannaschia sp.]|uniref:iron-containing alcohol dehydrogenase n=1 Tax=uncultured Jannaschia sp. TaxID=293347 RepID=UPI00262C6BBB|nr:iron-containing alcohol dehydrogenase [uncultured Jannaschia sp.]